MKLALRELRRRPGRFATASLTLTLVAVLVMFLGALLDGLIGGSTAAVRIQSGDLLVYSASADASFLRSRIDGDQRATIEAVDGVADTGGLGVVQLGARVPGNGPRDLAATALLGYEIAPHGVPDPPPPGQVYADDVLRADGVEDGMELLLGPARTPVTVAGFVSGTTYSGQGSLWAEPDTWRDVLAENRAADRLGDDVFQVLVVRLGDDADARSVAEAIDEATDGTTRTLTIGQAVDEVPGVSEQRSVFNQIIAVTIAIATVVVALFFALLTVERLALYGVLKALGARTSLLFGGLVTQAVVVTAVAVVVAGSFAFLLDAVIPPGSIPVDMTAGRLFGSALLLFAAAIVGCAFSLRRVLRVDPASAIGTAT